MIGPAAQKKQRVAVNPANQKDSQATMHKYPAMTQPSHTRKHRRRAPGSPLSLLTGLLLLCLTGAIAAEDLQQDNQAIHALLDGLHRDASEARFEDYFARFTPDAVFLGTDRSERWTIPEFKAYAAPVFAEGRGWTYHRVERHIEGSGSTRWFDEVLHNEKLGHCRGTGVVIHSAQGWRIAHYALTMLVPNSIAAEVGRQTQAAEAAAEMP